MVGVDFDKIEFQLFGLDLLEPMALITDGVLGLLSIFFAIKLVKVNSKLPFYIYWKWFFFIFGIGMIFGGIGHTFYNQLGMYGKVWAWIFGPIGIFLAEKAMIATHWNDKTKALLNKLVVLEMILTYIAFIILLFTAPESKKSTLPFLPIAINTMIGFIGIVGILSFKYTEKLSAKFKYFWLGILIMLPTALIFLMKINLHQWFDKNDFSHILFIIGITYFFLGVNSLSKGLKQST